VNRAWMEVRIDGTLRKNEWKRDSQTYKDVLATLKKHFVFEGAISAVSEGDGTKFAVYFSALPTVSPVDFTGVNDKDDDFAMSSLKFDLADNSVYGKVYYNSNRSNKKYLDKEIKWSAFLVTERSNENAAGYDEYPVTVYYDTPMPIVENSPNPGMTMVFAGVTIQADGTISGENIYTTEF